MRTPTVQYGYIEATYSIKIDENEGETIENAVRYVYGEHVNAVELAKEDEKNRKRAARSSDWDETPY